MTKNKKITTFSILKNFFSFLEKREKWMVVLGITFAILSSISIVVASFFTGIVITQIFEPSIKEENQFNTQYFVTLTVIMSLLFILYSVFGYLQNRIFVHISLKSATKIRGMAMNKLILMPTAFYDREMTGDLISTLVNDVNNVSNGVTKLLSSLFTNIFTLLFGVISMIFISSVLAIIIVVLTLLFMSITLWWLRKVRPAMIQTQNAFGDLNGYVEEMLRNTKITQTFDAQEKAQKGFNEIAQRIYKHAFIGDFYQRIFEPWFIFVSNTIVIVAIVLALIFKNNNISTYGILYNQADTGFTVALITSIFTFTGNFQALITLVLNLQLGFASSTRVFRLLELNPPTDPVDTVKLPKDVEGMIRFDKVWFKYNPDLASYQLRDASFYAKGGQTIAIVGPTGAGKTTIINLLSKFYYYQRGSITLDGIELNKIDKHDLRDVMAVVLQDSFMFNDTVLNNLKIAKPDATLEEVREVAKMLSADDFIQKMKNGYDTMIENNGLSLSQGERQLLAIVRAILGNKKILILDEATSNVDSNTEKIIQNALQEKIMKGKTSIVIAHRLSTIKNANLILVIENGQIIEKGDHQELMALKGYYWNLYETQFK
ncbi:ABC transporter ATP-binding protein [Mycoplasmopsis columbina]|uniref:ABC transporter ATP-binding protein n=1 Tax=Mycoplasmopsis columbina TaxID=114881 RepID=UPI0004A6BB1A|nr:ABC transporter ATP-binding protein [Mycoplasmopsis columbina]VEU76797.1 ABC-type multidrug/protein/lipid transport system ATPase component [Mycoplasmopsis columbina]